MSWGELLISLQKKSIDFQASPAQDAVVYYVRNKALGGEVLRGRNQKPFDGKPHIRGLALRLPEDYIYEELFPPVLEICNSYGIEMLHCKVNLINTL